MVETPDESHDPDPVAENADTIKSAWQQTVHDMNAMAQDREERGFDVLRIPAGDTAPEPPGSGEEDRYGLSHVIPDNKGEEFEEMYAGGDYSETGVYQLSNAGHVFIVTELIDADNRNVIYIAATYEMRHAPALVRTATDRGTMYTHVQLLDGTHLGTFEHDDVDAFFPDPEEFYAYESNI
jgi:hypothetical protein